MQQLIESLDNEYSTKQEIDKKLVLLIKLQTRPQMDLKEFLHLHHGQRPDRKKYKRFSSWTATEKAVFTALLDHMNDLYEIAWFMNICFYPAYFAPHHCSDAIVRLSKRHRSNHLSYLIRYTNEEERWMFNCLTTSLREGKKEIWFQLCDELFKDQVKTFIHMTYVFQTIISIVIRQNVQQSQLKNTEYQQIYDINPNTWLYVIYLNYHPCNLTSILSEFSKYCKFIFNQLCIYIERDLQFKSSLANVSDVLPNWEYMEKWKYLPSVDQDTVIQATNVLLAMDWLLRILSSIHDSPYVRPIYQTRTVDYIAKVRSLTAEQEECLHNSEEGVYFVSIQGIVRRQDKRKWDENRKTKRRVIEI